jgi:hypothetical protein
MIFAFGRARLKVRFLIICLTKMTKKIVILTILFTLAMWMGGAL